LGIGAYMAQPHFILAPTLRQQIDKLKAETLELNSRPSTRPTKPISMIDHYTHQITTWIASMTALQRQRTYTLEEIIALAGLKGHFRSRASNQFTGEALRRSNFYPKRDWTNSGRNKRYWKLKKETI
jgi:hypothetical protein